jgi:hypothetical protein
VSRCDLEPNGTFYVEALEPSVADKRHAELMRRLEALQAQVAALGASGLTGESGPPQHPA